MTTTYCIRQMSPDVRCRWVYDELYETRGSFAYDSEEETKEAEDEEIRLLESGECVALGCIVEHRVPCCSLCGREESWEELDSLWGIVISPTDDELDDFARECLEGVPEEATK